MFSCVGKVREELRGWKLGVLVTLHTKFRNEPQTKRTWVIWLVCHECYLISVHYGNTSQLQELERTGNITSTVEKGDELMCVCALVLGLLSPPFQNHDFFPHHFMHIYIVFALYTWTTLCIQVSLVAHSPSFTQFCALFFAAVSHPDSS